MGERAATKFGEVQMEGVRCLGMSGLSMKEVGEIRGQSE